MPSQAMTATPENVLPLLDALLILASGASLVLGYGFIRRGHVTAHRRSMLTATALAAAFLIVYAIRQLVLETRVFPERGWLRDLYLGILIPHSILAVAIVPLVLLVLRHALRGAFPQHKRLARITLPLWLFVALSGWVIYWMLYHL